MSKYITDISFSFYFSNEIFPVPGSSGLNGLNQGKLLLWTVSKWHNLIKCWKFDWQGNWQDWKIYQIISEFTGVKRKRDSLDN